MNQGKGKKKVSNMKTLAKHIMRAEVIENWNYLVVNCWLNTNYTPYFTGIFPHFIVMAEIEALKAEFEKQTSHIV